MRPKRKHLNVAVAVGNHRKGYRGRVDRRFDDGHEEVVIPECDHRHQTTHAARTCAALRMYKTS